MYVFNNKDVNITIFKSFDNCSRIGFFFSEKMLYALRHCEPEMPTLLNSRDGFTNASITMDVFAQSAMGICKQATPMKLANNSLVEEDISSTSSPSALGLTSPTTSTMVVHTLAELYDRELVNTIGWAKQIPGMYFPTHKLLCLKFLKNV